MACKMYWLGSASMQKRITTTKQCANNQSFPFQRMPKSIYCDYWI